MTNYGKHITKNASYALWKIGRIRHLLSPSVTEQLVHAFVTSRLDHCNALRTALTASHIRPLQTIQNSDGRMIVRVHSYTHTTWHQLPILHELHWLPISHRIQFKFLLVTFKSLHGLAPGYLTELISWYIHVH